MQVLPCRPTCAAVFLCLAAMEATVGSCSGLGSLSVALYRKSAQCITKATKCMKVNSNFLHCRCSSAIRMAYFLKATLPWPGRRSEWTVSSQGNISALTELYPKMASGTFSHNYFFTSQTCKPCNAWK